MLKDITLSEEVLIDQLRHAKTEKEINKIIESTIGLMEQEIAEPANVLSFTQKMRQKLSSINPFYIDDATEWNNIQTSKVLFYRVGCRFTAIH
jgi:hypothetical protein